ncbi:MAG: hypothetical protein A2992_03880 [Elusimicrobia bacterium RIFCSPLOWO2_01_FULL_59_12]|nr:MAG: hypothetical protein A2992_03880 [Elusimicrobia bacterium RIFCSPLOWO2_01_FULL_59_12]
MAEKVIIIGGGFAGLSAATALAERGYRVIVLEGRQVLGGRAYSFADPQSGDAVDNGQHLFMGCYFETRAFLKRIGQEDAIHFQPSLSADFADTQGGTARLRCWRLPAPWHLLSGLMRLSSLSWADRFRLLYMSRALRHARTHPDELGPLTVEQWLTRWNQSERARHHLWDLIAIAALNEDPAIASAAPFAAVLERAFFAGTENARLGFATAGLSDLYVRAAGAFIEERGGEVRVKSPVESILLRNDRIEGVRLREGSRLAADWVISAVPAPALLKMLPEAAIAAEPVFQRMRRLRPAPIISFHLWFDRAITRRAFVGLLDTHVQWVFNKSAILSLPKGKEGYVSAVISGAHAFIDWPESKLLGMVLEELRRVFPKAREAALVRSRVIKEHQATLSPAVGSEALRPAHPSPYRGLLLAGDWTKTGLPATIESACLSGHACARIVTQGKPSIDSQVLQETAHA